MYDIAEKERETWKKKKKYRAPLRIILISAEHGENINEINLRSIKHEETMHRYRARTADCPDMELAQWAIQYRRRQSMAMETTAK